MNEIPLDGFLEILRSSDRLIKDGQTPTDIKYRTMEFLVTQIAFIMSHESSRSYRDELFRRRDELEKSNYFRSVFVGRYINLKVYETCASPEEDWDEHFEKLAASYGEGHIENPRFDIHSSICFPREV